MMDPTTARGLIVSGATSNGLTISDQDADKAAQQLASSVTRDEQAGTYVPIAPDGSRAFRVVDGQAIDIEFVDHVLGVVRQYARKAKPAAPPPRPESMNKTATARERLAGLRTAQSGDAVAAALAEGNPWARATWNRSRQHLIGKHNPEAARELRQQAGAR
ncbi:hypothetical protein [uncultured Methylobacterium sp.]|uniref:hypothetical protein n=1 Tax=uncultured Methylobacterium sp. TaxID=157278 RepID=UPI0025842892|nr:hypothetical protein [uncultured Methylobacterium sp.]